MQRLGPKGSRRSRRLAAKPLMDCYHTIKGALFQQCYIWEFIWIYSPVMPVMPGVRLEAYSCQRGAAGIRSARPPRPRRAPGGRLVLVRCYWHRDCSTASALCAKSYWATAQGRLPTQPRYMPVAASRLDRKFLFSYPEDKDSRLFLEN